MCPPATRRHGVEVLGGEKRQKGGCEWYAPLPIRAGGEPPPGRKQPGCAQHRDEGDNIASAAWSPGSIRLGDFPGAHQVGSGGGGEGLGQHPDFLGCGAGREGKGT